MRNGQRTAVMAALGGRWALVVAEPEAARLFHSCSSSPDELRMAGLAVGPTADGYAATVAAVAARWPRFGGAPVPVMQALYAIEEMRRGRNRPEAVAAALAKAGL